MGFGRISEWMTMKLRDSQSLNKTQFTSLRQSESILTTRLGPVLGAPNTYLLVCVWNSREAREAFWTLPVGRTLSAELQKLCETEIHTELIDFNLIFWPALGLHTELRNVYFPSTLSLELQDQVRGLAGLSMPYGLGIGGSSASLQPYRKVPICGWVEELQVFEGTEVLTCKWINSWNSPEQEKRFKEELFNPLEDDGSEELVLHAWERELKDLGALGWEDIHVDLE